MTDVIDRCAILGHGVAELYGPDGVLKDRVEFRNLVTQVGDQWYVEQAHGLGSWNAIAGMKLGTSATPAAKTGAAAFIGTGSYITGSAQPLDGAPVSSLSGSSRRITMVTTFAAGEGTSSTINEVAIVVEATLTDAGNADATTTIARAVFASTINKGASDVLIVTWRHDFLGA